MVSFILPGNSATGGYEVDNSLRFNDGSSDHLTRSLGASETSTTKGTFSFWVKRGQLTTAQMIYTNEVADDNNRGQILFEDNDTFMIRDTVSGSNTTLYATSQLFKDTSSWYNMVVALDSTASAGERIKVFKNGTRIPDAQFGTSTEPSANANFNVLTGGQTNKNHIGKVHGGSNYFDGYLAEFVYCDGQVLDATSFGEFDEDSGIWKPIDVSGLTFGNNGFYLDFENSGSLGADVSGNGNNFTVNNLTSIDQTSDSCTNNFATWNPLFRKGTTTPAFAEGNLKSTFDDGGANEFALTTFGVDTGKWYAEVKWTSATGTGATATGILDMAYSGTADPNNAVTNAFGYFGNGNKNVSGTASSYGASYTSGDIIGIALNCDDNQVTFYKNGSSQGAISIISGVTYGIFASDYNNKVAELNTGNPPFSISSGNADANGYGNFEYAVPSGYYAINTKNLAEYG